ncbi:hypothetical protein KAU11_02885, partial [Candidatus Babeliales bacterium]|nr:hypothetical protein [Candidatus Babeliales bacterium]
MQRWGRKLLLFLAVSSFGIGVSLFSQLASDLLAPATSIDPSTASIIERGGGFLASLKGYATQASKKTLGTITALKPLCTFFVRFPINFMQSIKNTKYSDRKFTVYQTEEARMAHTASLNSAEFEGVRGREFGDDGSFGYRIEYDLGFEGGGDINQPVGFKFVDGKYYYRPVKGRMIPSAMQLQGERTSLDLWGSRSKILQYFMLKTMALILGSNARAVQMWNGVRGIMKLKPEHVFFIKALNLLSAGSVNSVAGVGYPRYGHVPTELTLLFARMAQTPDLKKCLELNDGVKYPSQWTKIQKIDVSELMATAVFPGLLRDLANIVKVPVEENEIQKMRDRKGKPYSQMQLLYSQMRGTFNYNERSKFGTQNILTIDYNVLTKTDKALYLYTVRKHIAERFKGLRSLVMQYIRDYTFAIEGEPEVGEIGPAEVTLELEPTEAEMPAPTGRMNIGSITGMIKDRIPPLKEFIRTAIAKFKQYRISDSDIQFLREIENTVDFQVKTIEDFGGAASVAEVSGNDAKAVESAERLEALLEDFEKKEIVELATGISDRQVLLRFPDYLKLRAYQFEDMFFQRFKGDVGYLFDDAYLTPSGAVSHAMAVLLRAARDQSKAEELFKKDARPYLMKNRDGTEVQITGATLYRDKIVKAEQYMASAENSLASAQAEATQGDLTSDLDGLFNGATKASQVYRAYKSEFAYYLRQYPFDRRDVTPVRSIVSEIEAVIPKSGEEVLSRLRDL